MFQRQLCASSGLLDLKEWVGGGELGGSKSLGPNYGEMTGGSAGKLVNRCRPLSLAEMTFVPQTELRVAAE